MPVRAELDEAHYDVVVVGGGMVGSMLAAALAAHGQLRIAVIEHQLPQAFTPGSDPDYDIRVSALSIATQRMFENVGAWQGVTARRACPYREMLVWDGEQQGQTHFKASDIHASELGHIVENRVIQLALLDVLGSSACIDYLCPAKLTHYEVAPDRVVCELERADAKPDEDSCSIPASISARLLVGADGARSRVRELAGISFDTSVYPQQALVATIETALPQQDITWQRFMPTGPQAFLPLCGSKASMVWYHSAEEVQRLQALSDTEFIKSMQNCFPERLGGILRVLNRGSFPIAKAQAGNYIAQRIALIGDAAHTVHPLAGQGVNLGMMDAAALAQVVQAASDEQADPGSGRVLRRYERWRRGENALMINILDGFYQAFKPQPKPVQLLRSAALGMVDNFSPLKSMIMRHAMGTGAEIPDLAKMRIPGSG